MAERIDRGRKIIGLDMHAVVRRINERLKKVGLSARAAGLKAGLSGDVIHSLRKQVKSGVQHSIHEYTVRKLAEPLQTRVEYLLHGKDGPVGSAPAPKARRRPTRRSILPSLSPSGDVASGHWYERPPVIETGSHADLIEAIPPDPRDRIEGQFAVRVVDNSISRVARIGDYLVASSDREPTDGDIVIVERIRDGILHELTARVFRVNGEHKELSFDSDDESFSRQPPIRYENKNGRDVADDIEIKIHGVVLSVRRVL